MFTFGLTFSEKLIIQSLIAAFSKRFHWYAITES
jgi:hypothetical protein